MLVGLGVNGAHGIGDEAAVGRALRVADGAHARHVVEVHGALGNAQGGGTGSEKASDQEASTGPHGEKSSL